MSKLAISTAILAAAPLARAVGEAANSFVVQGNTGASAQQLFLGTLNTVYIVDKTENNSMQIDGHPAWATEITLSNNSVRAFDVITNSFCAGGGVLGNGTWVNAGGNLAIGVGGVQATNGAAPYEDTDGGAAIRLLDPCDDGSCAWVDKAATMLQRRWYPTLETVADGSILILGGDEWGGFVNQASQTVPSYEFFPPKFTTTPPNLTILEDTLPYNLYPISFIMPSNTVLIQAGWSAAIFDYNTGTETQLPNITKAVRCYPASGASALLPLTPANNYTGTAIFCGGLNITAADSVNTPDWFRQQQASTSCVTISPDVSQEWVDDDDLPEGRVMGNFIYLPDGRLFLTNGISSGAAGYNDSDVPYGINAIMTPAIYDPSQPKGKKWSTEGLGTLNYERLYHSSATLLPNGCVYIAGSNPYVDVVLPGNSSMETYTQYTAETWCPSYFNKTRPAPSGLPTSLSYGGNYFNISLTAAESGNLTNTKVTLVRPGFSTHAMNMGQRFLELNMTYTRNSDNSSVLHVSQMPPNAAIFPPGPALMFVVADGIPSEATMIMVGSGSIGTQPVSQAATLPTSSGTASTDQPSTSSTTKGGNGSGSGSSSGAEGLRTVGGAVLGMVLAVVGGLTVFA